MALKAPLHAYADADRARLFCEATLPILGNVGQGQTKASRSEPRTVPRKLLSVLQWERWHNIRTRVGLCSGQQKAIPHSGKRDSLRDKVAPSLVSITCIFKTPQRGQAAAEKSGPKEGFTDPDRGPQGTPAHQLAVNTKTKQFRFTLGLAWGPSFIEFFLLVLLGPVSQMFCI